MPHHDDSRTADPSQTLSEVVEDDQLIRWDADGQPLSQRFDDVYFSRHSGIDESRYVFIDHNRLPERWATLAPQAQFIIGETGFGTGLNFLVAWNLWRQTAPQGASLHFVSVEKYPLSRAQLRQALQLWPQLSPLTGQLVDAYPPMPARGFQRLVFDQGRVQLTLILDDAVTGFRQLLPLEQPGAEANTCQPTWAGNPVAFDAIFLDGFAPAKNPDMWSPALFSTLARLSRPGTTVATFSAAGVVRHGLTATGFNVRKVSGFGRKRHMVCGSYAAEPPSLARGDTFELAWHAIPKRRDDAGSDPRAIVVGAGLAGCHTARALAERGFQVTVLERDKIASGASGNPRGVVYAKASSRDQPLTRFNLTALQFACRYYQTRTGYHTSGEACGVVHLAQNARQAEEYRTLAKRYCHESDFVRWLDQEQTEDECGLSLNSGALLFPQAGWLDPGHLCRELLNHPAIQCREGQEVAHVEHESGEWQAFGPSKTLLAEAPTLVIANAADALRLRQTAHLPVKAIRGQTTEAVASTQSHGLRRVLCGTGYIAPAHSHVHHLGASFNLGETDETPNPQDDKQNLARVAELSPALAELGTLKSGRVGFRCTTPDYLPLVGTAPVHDAFLEQFAALRRNARARVPGVGPHYPGLFVNIGHGSRGLAYTPLCAELLASLIAGSPLPLEKDMVMRLHPARFLLRDLKRNRI